MIAVSIHLTSTIAIAVAVAAASAADAYTSEWPQRWLDIRIFLSKRSFGGWNGHPSLNPS